MKRGKGGLRTRESRPCRLGLPVWAGLLAWWPSQAAARASLEIIPTEGRNLYGLVLDRLAM